MQPENNLAQCSSVAYLDDNYRPLCSHDTALYHVFLRVRAAEVKTI